jgi:hypothetical protein
MVVWAVKTTVEISDEALEEARRVAAEEGTSLRSLIEEGLRRALDERRGRRAAFRLRRASFRGKGLSAEFADASWADLRDAAYRERGA